MVEDSLKSLSSGEISTAQSTLPSRKLNGAACLFLALSDHMGMAENKPRGLVCPGGNLRTAAPGLLLLEQSLFPRAGSKVDRKSACLGGIGLRL